MTSLTSSYLIERIGNTPVIELKSFSTRNIKFYAKLEWYNPYGSVKDRAAYWMIKHAENDGILKKGKSISTETKDILRRLGATIHETSDDLCPRVGAGTDQSIALAKAISKPRPDVYYMPNQYDNEANFMAHYESTGPEIWKQMDGRLTHFFTGCGTGGTITGTATYLKEQNRNVKVIAVQAQKNNLLQ